MNAGDGEVDFGLTLGYSNNCIRSRLNKNPGAGVNAGSGVDMTFAASDPLTELVWSPHKGLSLKCAECSKADEKPFLPWNVGPSNMVLSPSQGIRCKEIDDDKIVQGNLGISHATFHLDSGIDPRVSMTQCPWNDVQPMDGSSHGRNMENSDKIDGRSNKEGDLPKHRSQTYDRMGDMVEKEVCSPCNLQVADMTDGSQKNTGQVDWNLKSQESSGSDFNKAPSKPLCGQLNKEVSTDCNGMIREVIDIQQIQAGVTTASKVQTEMQSRACICASPKSTNQSESIKEVALAIEENSKVKTNDSELPSLEKLEFTAENDLQHMSSKEAYWQSGERLLRGSSAPLESAPVNGNEKKSKYKALSDGNFSRKFSSEEDGSHESVESCTSTSRGKKRLKFEDNLIVESKRIKKQIDGSPAANSIIRNDSSFLNWISNMVTGFSKANQEDSHSLALTTPAHSDEKDASTFQETVICSKHHDSEGRNNGFQTLFQFLSSSNSKLSKARVSRDDCFMVKSKVDLQAAETSIENSTNNCSGQKGASCNYNVVSNESIIQSPGIFSASTPAQVNTGVQGAENNYSCNPNCSSDSLGKHKTTAAEKGSHDLASEGRAIHEESYKSNLFGSLWMTRLSPKTSTAPNLDHNKQISCEMNEHPADYSAVKSQFQINPDFPLEQKSSEAMDNSENLCNSYGKDSNMFAPYTESSIGIKDAHGHNHQNAVLKLNPILPSQKFKSSEAMASVFARRLDALKLIMPSSSINGASCWAATCLFCRRSCNNLEDVSEVSETELENLLLNISAIDAAKDSTCLCIRCYQFNHWALTCPVGSSNRQQKSEKNLCLNASNMKLCPTNDRKSCFLGKEDYPKCAREKSHMDTDLRDPVTSGNFLGPKGSSSHGTQKQLTSDSGENGLRHSQNLALNTFVSSQIVEVPRVLFDAIRRLQMSRADILRLMNSHSYVSNVEGFFLRLRLGKWEAGLGETGYYVALITGVSKLVKDSKKSVSVNVGGFKCQVGIQYVSNQDFLEDELMTWWCRTLKNGGKIPSKEDLESKFKQRIKLGI